MHIKNVIFDFGGVIIDANARYLLSKFFNNEAKLEVFLESVQIHENWHVPADLGQPIEDVNVAFIEKFPEYEEQIRAYDKRWAEILGNPISGSVDIFRALEARGNLGLYGLTNWPTGKFSEARKKITFIDSFNDIVVSSVEKVAKPDPEIYRILLDRNNLDPATCLFIDDRLENITTALDLGFQGHHFKDPEKLRQDLMRRALL